MLAQQNLTSPSASDESRRLRMLLNNRNMALGKDGLTNSVGDVVSNVGSPLQAGGPLLARSDTDMLLKVILLLSITLPSAVIVVSRGENADAFISNIHIRIVQLLFLGIYIRAVIAVIIHYPHIR